jgi:phage baseplate assembly protein gpV
LAPEPHVQRIRFELPDGSAVTHEVHVHRTRVELPDGTAVTAVSFLGDRPYDRDPAPAFGLYLDERWAPPWPHEQVAWPDFGLPPDVAGLRAALVDLLDRSRAGEGVELGCLGGHGRTGTALACLAVLTGTPPADAVDWVRAHYCDRAVETDAQRSFVETFGN